MTEEELLNGSSMYILSQEILRIPRRGDEYSDEGHKTQCGLEWHDKRDKQKTIEDLWHNYDIRCVKKDSDTNRIEKEEGERNQIKEMQRAPRKKMMPSKFNTTYQFHVIIKKVIGWRLLYESIVNSINKEPNYTCEAIGYMNTKFCSLSRNFSLSFSSPFYEASYLE